MKSMYLRHLLCFVVIFSHLPPRSKFSQTTKEMSRLSLPRVALAPIHSSQHRYTSRIAVRPREDEHVNRLRFRDGPGKDALDRGKGHKRQDGGKDLHSGDLKKDLAKAGAGVGVVYGLSG